MNGRLFPSSFPPTYALPHILSCTPSQSPYSFSERTMGPATSSLFSLPIKASTMVSAKRIAVPGPRDVMSLSDTTTRSSEYL